VRLRSVGTDNGGVSGCHYIIEGAIAVNLLPPHRCSRETPYLGLQDRPMAMLLVSFSLFVASFGNKF
jgi:hypothetical protein